MGVHLWAIDAFIGKAGSELSEGYITMARAHGGCCFVHLSIPLLHPEPNPIKLATDMSEKDGIGLQKEIHNGSVRRTSFTEVDLNKNLSAK